MKNIERVGVVGAGQMGAGIAEVSLRAGADVRIYEPTDALDALSGGASSIELSGDEDDDLVLGGSSGPGSDVTRSAGDAAAGDATVAISEKHSPLVVNRDFVEVEKITWGG